MQRGNATQRNRPAPGPCTIAEARTGKFTRIIPLAHRLNVGGGEPDANYGGNGQFSVVERHHPASDVDAPNGRTVRLPDRVVYPVARVRDIDRCSRLAGPERVTLALLALDPGALIPPHSRVVFD